MSLYSSLSTLKKAYLQLVYNKRVNNDIYFEME